MMPPTIDASNDVTSLDLAMKKEIASLRASQVSTNREITYLRRNQDRVIREFGSELRNLRHRMKIMQNQVEAVEESQRRLLRRVQYHEAIPSVSGSASPSAPSTTGRTPTLSESRPRRLELRRQGAFRGGDINNLPWAELNDVRGFNQNAPRYHWSATESPSMRTGAPHNGRKRAREDAEEDTDPIIFFEACKRYKQAEETVASEDAASPPKRRRASSGARVARLTTAPPLAPAGGSVFSRSAASKNNVTRRSTSLLSGIITGVSSVFLS